ncbi:hypothetical protein [Ferruginibacter sp.]|nr:hypothetical protein [Ferruginibacter sp.]
MGSFVLPLVTGKWAEGTFFLPVTVTTIKKASLLLMGSFVLPLVTGKWAEGTFFFTGYSYDNKKSITVTNGFFRIAFGK